MKIFLSLILISLSLGATELEELSKHPIWLRLLHFKDSSSRVDSKEYFIHPQGNTNSKLELEATINAFSENQTLGNDAWKAACSFPARYQFLIEHGYKFPKPECTDYNAWRKQLDIKSVSLVFSSYYPGNPASTFGHTFLKLNFDENHVSKLTDYAVSFSARATDPMGVIYALKGLLGGYQAFYEISPYYMKLNEYVHTESRDIWEYPILLSPVQIDRLLAHLWEQYKKASYSYWFTKENCSFQLLALLDVAFGDTNLAEESEFTVLPAKTVKQVEATGKLGFGTIRPSFKKQLLYRYKLLTKLERQEYEQELDQKFQSKNANVLDAVIAKIRYEQLKVNDEIEKRKEISKKLLPILQRRAALKIKTEDFKKQWYESMSKENPVLSHNAGKIQVNSGIRNDKTTFGFEARLGLHSPTDREEGLPRHSEVNYLSIAIDHRNDKTLVQRIRIIDILSLQPRSAANSGFSWRAGAGAIRRLGYRSGLAPQSAFSVGYSIAPTTTFSLYSLIGAEASVHSSHLKDIAIGNNVELGLIYTPSWFKLRHHLMGYVFHDYNKRRPWIKASLTSQYALNKNWEVGLKGQYIFNTPYQIKKKSDEYLAMILRHF